MQKSLVNAPKNALLASTLDYIVVDGSSSMLVKWRETLLALDTYLDALRASNLNSHMICSQFRGGSPENIYIDCLLRDAPSFSCLEGPMGTTPLYDAIQCMGRHMRDLDPPSAAILIATDGDEMGSQFTTLDQARAILDWCRAKGWQVIFIGCDFNNQRQAQALGASERKAIGIQKTKLAEAGKLLADKRIRYAQSGQEIDFTSDEQSQFGGYLASPDKGSK